MNRIVPIFGTSFWLLAVFGYDWLLAVFGLDWSIMRKKNLADLILLLFIGFVYNVHETGRWL